MKVLRIVILAGLGVGVVAAWTNRTYLYQKTVPPEERLRLARERGLPKLKERMRAVGLKFPAGEVYFRAFKKERILQLLMTAKAGGKFTMVHEYPIEAMSGGLGPKRKEGDRQVPEGLYEIDRFNPQSGFWLSLGINYPNASDRILSDQKRPGGDIFIHGSNKSIGCLAMTDPQIEEIYLAALAARTGGQRVIRVDIFPQLEPPQTNGLWRSLEAALEHFETHARPAPFRVASDGTYVITK